MVPTMHHITLQTGHVAQQARQDVSDEAVATVNKMFEGILAGKDVSLSAIPGYVVNGARAKDSLMVTLWRDDELGCIPVLTTGIALDACDSSRLWGYLCSIGNPEYGISTPPTPWIADRLEPGMGILDPVTLTKLLTWTGDWARTLGWSWAEYISAERRRRS